jgi:hypothetical protein
MDQGSSAAADTRPSWETVIVTSPILRRTNASHLRQEAPCWQHGRGHHSCRERSRDITSPSGGSLCPRGRQPEAWKDLRDDRHPSQVARELAAALGFTQEIVDEEMTMRIAAAVCASRPRAQRWVASDFAEFGASEAPASTLAEDSNHVVVSFKTTLNSIRSSPC